MHSQTNSELLDELYEFTQLQDEGIELSQQESQRYVEIVDILKFNDVEIPFGIEL